MAVKPRGIQKQNIEPLQYWGIKIRKLRESPPGKCTRTRFLYLYHKELEEFDPKRFGKFEIQDHTYARAERGENVKFNRVQLELLCKAGRATEEQRLEILTAANLDPYLDINGNLSQIGELCQLVTKLLSRSKHAQRLAHNTPAEHMESSDILKLLQQILDAELADTEWQKRSASQVNKGLGSVHASP